MDLVLRIPFCVSTRAGMRLKGSSCLGLRVFSVRAVDRSDVEILVTATQIFGSEKQTALTTILYGLKT